MSQKAYMEVESKTPGPKRPRMSRKALPKGAGLAKMPKELTDMPPFVPRNPKNQAFCPKLDKKLIRCHVPLCHHQ